MNAPLLLTSTARLSADGEPARLMGCHWTLATAGMHKYIYMPGLHKCSSRSVDKFANEASALQSPGRTVRPTLRRFLTTHHPLLELFGRYAHQCSQSSYEQLYRFLVAEPGT